MSADWPRVRALFEAALDQPAADRRSWLELQTGADAEVRRQVERLLAAADAPDTLGDLEPPPLDGSGGSGGGGAFATRHLGPFRLVERLGDGGMGSVWRAEQEHPRRQVAVKVLHRSCLGNRHAERFRAEIDALARLQHPGIAQVFEAGVEADGTAWFAMELVDGATPITALRAAAAGPAAPRELVRTFLAVTDALQHAHQRGVIHRDLKPANILRCGDGSVKVIDFGIARFVDGDGAGPTRDGELLGTLAYMSPEQIQGAATDVRTDVYGLGVVLYELLAGRRPFDLGGLPITAACRAVLDREPTPVRTLVPHLPEELQWIVHKAIHKLPAERYQDVGAFAADLRSLLRHEPVRAAPPSALYPLRKFVRRHRLGVATTAAVVVVSLGALVTTSLALVRARAAETAERQRRTEAEDASQRASSALDFLLSVLQSVRPDRGSKDVKLVDALTSAATSFDRELADSPTVRAALGRAIGIAWFSLGQLDAAEQRLRASLAVHEATYGADAVQTAQVRVDLCQVLVQRGELDDAERCLAAAERVTATLPDGDPTRLSGRIRRADLLRARGDKAAADATLQPVVDWLRTHQPDSRETLLAVNLLAGIRHERGDVDGAEPLYRSAIAGFQARGEHKNLDYLTAQNNLVMVLNSRGRREEMVPVLEQLAATCREALGPQHPQTIGTLSNLGGLRYMLGDFTAARDTFRDALAAFPKDTDEHDRVLQAVLANLAKLEMETGDLTAALPHGERVLATRRKLLGDDHELTLQTAIMVADVHRRDGRLAAALAILRDADQRAAAAAPPQWPNRYRALVLIAECQIAAAEFAAAEQSLQVARELFEQAEASQAVKQTLTPLARVQARLYRAWGKPDEAAKFDSKPSSGK